MLLNTGQQLSVDSVEVVGDPILINRHVKCPSSHDQCLFVIYCQQIIHATYPHCSFPQLHLLPSPPSACSIEVNVLAIDTTMAPASDTALGINEIVSIILSCLPKKHLKSARLVNKIWASLGGQMLIGTLYISPREIDMAAFDGITRHADLSKSVKHVVYDTAQFKKYDNFAVYYAVLDKAFQNNAFLHLGSAQSRMDQFCSRVDRLQWELYETDVWNLRDSDSDSNANTGFDDPEFEVYWTHPTFIDGYQQYLVHAAESCNIFRPLWGARVVRGLKALGPIFSFAFENTWNAIYAADGYSHYMYDGT